MDDANWVMDNVLATAIYATWSAVRFPNKTTPGVLVYGRDMILDVPFIKNLTAIRYGQQQMINKYLIRQNEKRIEHNFRVGDRVK